MKRSKQLAAEPANAFQVPIANLEPKLLKRLPKETTERIARGTLEDNLNPEAEELGRTGVGRLLNTDARRRPPNHFMEGGRLRASQIGKP